MHWSSAKPLGATERICSRYSETNKHRTRKGLVALTIDGIGQGERRIPDYTSYGGAPSNAHQIIGKQAFLAGTHLFNLMAWDVIRAVDYLVSRPEVDPERIACTGCSGGGMMTSYILPFEPRIRVAVPACNPNTWSYRVHAGLPTDHEQVFAGAFAAWIELQNNQNDRDIRKYARDIIKHGFPPGVKNRTIASNKTGQPNP